ncbi:hypothetical protein VPH35_101650 [Triticum aestivum]
MLPPPTPMPPPVPWLPDGLLEEVFLRLPPDEPACLVRASLANKHWFGLLSGARFRSRYREFHGDAPMLGFLYNTLSHSGSAQEDDVPLFFSTTKFGARIPFNHWKDYTACDCRHGRALLCDEYAGHEELVVWDPVTGCRTDLDAPYDVFDSYGAAVLCAVSGCDHRACQEGPFRVAFVGTKDTEVGCVIHSFVSNPSCVCGGVWGGGGAFMLPVTLKKVSADVTVVVVLASNVTEEHSMETESLAISLGNYRICKLHVCLMISYSHTCMFLLLQQVHKTVSGMEIFICYYAVICNSASEAGATGQQDQLRGATIDVDDQLP